MTIKAKKRKGARPTLSYTVVLRAINQDSEWLASSPDIYGVYAIANTEVEAVQKLRLIITTQADVLWNEYGLEMRTGQARMLNIEV